MPKWFNFAPKLDWMKEEQEKLLKYIGDLYEQRRLEKSKSQDRKSDAAKHDDITEAGKRIRKTREKKGMSIEELATQSDLLPSFISEIEIGEADPYMTEIQAIAKALDVDLSYLFGKKK